MEGGIDDAEANVKVAAINPVVDSAPKWGGTARFKEGGEGGKPVRYW